MQLCHFLYPSKVNFTVYAKNFWHKNYKNYYYIISYIHHFVNILCKYGKRRYYKNCITISYNIKIVTNTFVTIKIVTLNRFMLLLYKQYLLNFLLIHHLLPSLPQQILDRKSYPICYHLKFCQQSLRLMYE